MTRLKQNKNQEGGLVSVVIPIYKPRLSKYEIISLTQCLRVLYRYPIIFAAPESLEVSYYLTLTKELSNTYFLRFDDKFFEGISGHNSLLLSRHFYSSFSDYEY